MLILKCLVCTIYIKRIQ